jgi:hypothetical protein
MINCEKKVINAEKENNQRGKDKEREERGKESKKKRHYKKEGNNFPQNFCLQWHYRVRVKVSLGLIN